MLPRAARGNYGACVILEVREEASADERPQAPVAG
jgi:hypothetical protein